MKITNEHLDEMRRIISTEGASSDVLHEVANRFHTTKSFAEMVVEGMRAEGIVIGAGILESYTRPTRGSTMATRTVNSITTTEAQEIGRILGKNGTSAPVLANLRKQYRLDETSMSAFAQAFDESRAQKVTSESRMPPLMETAPPRQRFIMESAEVLRDRANTAEANLSKADHQGLEALAGMMFPR